MGRPAVFELDEETQNHMRQAMEEETSPPPDRPEPAVHAEPANEPQQEVKAEKPDDRPRNPDGTFAKPGEKVETKVEAKPPEKPQEAPQRQESVVPHVALHEERQRRKELQAKVETMEKRWEQIVAKLSETKQPPPPDPQVDFVGHVQHNFQNIQQNQGDLAKRVENFEAWQNHQAQEARFLQAYSMAAQQFASNAPDFGSAYNHWLKSELEELADAGYTSDQAMQIRSGKERAIVLKAFEDGVNPAERLYAVAKRRGYTAGSAKPAEPKQETKPAVDPAEKLRTIEQGQRATPQMSGGGMKPKLTLASIATMSDAEFAALDWDKTMRELTP